MNLLKFVHIIFITENKIDYFPYNIDDSVEPVYIEKKGWNVDTTKITSESEFPKELVDYIAYLEAELETPISIVSVGPDRSQTIQRDKSIGLKLYEKN